MVFGKTFIITIQNERDDRAFLFNFMLLHSSHISETTSTHKKKRKENKSKEKRKKNVHTYIQYKDAVSNLCLRKVSVNYFISFRA